MDTPPHQLQHLLTTVPHLTREDVVAMLPLVAALQSALSVKLLTLPQPYTENPHVLLDAKETARRLGISTKQLYRIAHRLPFTVREVGGVRFHAGRLTQYLATQAQGE